ncbi:unnamed protein product [Paramecium sonneborni]|uniref:Uncharacterized protein n=1 Tax=Paramecium sonneborni TaxID=65129 RepID=A0A8S1R9R6_9CILI|nr:unnamed protein product [Paramecium sonneborni]
MYNSFCDEISKRPSIWVERTTITKSATAAAGSGDLHAYRRYKRADTLRQREEEEINQERQEHEDFQKTREEKFMISQEITNKKHNKRVQEKLKLKIKKEAAKIEKKAIQLNKFPNDGSYYELFKQLKSQEQEEQQKLNEIKQQLNEESIIDKEEENNIQQSQNSQDNQDSKKDQQ